MQYFSTFNFITLSLSRLSKSARSRTNRPSLLISKMPAKITSASWLVDKPLRSVRSAWRASTFSVRRRSLSSVKLRCRRSARLRRSVYARRPKRGRRSASCRSMSRSRRRQSVNDWSRSRRLNWEPKPSRILILR